MCVCVLLLMMLLGRKYLVLSVVLNLCAEISLYSALPSQSTASMVFIPCSGKSQGAESTVRRNYCFTSICWLEWGALVPLGPRMVELCVSIEVGRHDSSRGSEWLARMR
jgi:hypothetical protein